MKTLIAFLLTIACYSAFSQTMINGIVKDSNGQPVFAANVYLKSNPQAGKTTDFDGNFSLKIEPKLNTDTLIVSFIGFKTSKLPLSQLTLREVLQIELEEENQTLEQVNIVAKEPISEQFSVTKMEALDIYLNPVSNADPLKAITVLPASTTTDESANPSLRGSAADRTRVIVNGVPVYRPVRNSQIDGVGHFSLFNTEIIHKQYVYASNPPLTYGNTSAGLVEIETINELKENGLSLSAGLAHIGAFISQKVNNQSFLQAYTNFQFSDGFMEVNRKNMPNLKGFGSKDAGINFYSNLGKSLSFNLFSYGILEDYRVNFDLYTYNGDAVGDKKRNFNIVNIKYQFKNGFVSLNNGTNFSETSYSYGNVYSKNRRTQVYTSVDYKQIASEKLNFQFGLNHDYSSDNFTDSIATNYYALSPASDNYYNKNTIENQLLEGYAYASYYITDKALLSGGIRKNIPLENRESYLSSQVGIKYHFDSKQSILLSGGIYHSYTVPNYFMENYELLKSEQVALDYALEINKLKINAAIFYKDETGKQIDSDYRTVEHTLTQGAEIYFDYYFSKSLKWTFANTYLNQKVKIDGDEYTGEKDLNYFIKTTLNYSNPKFITAAITYIGRPGLHYSPVVNSRYDDVSGFYQPFYANTLNSAQYADYNNISVNISKYIQFYDQVFIFYASCNNVLNFKNQGNPIYSRDYSTQTFNNYQLRTVYFGMVWEIRY
jgi:hypothetical protein